jgi:hypothetical protein
VQHHARRPRIAIDVTQCWKPMARTTGPFEATRQHNSSENRSTSPGEEWRGFDLRSSHLYGIHVSDSAASYALQAASDRFTTRDMRPSQSIDRRAKPYSEHAHNILRSRQIAKLFASRRRFGQLRQKSCTIPISRIHLDRATSSPTWTHAEVSARADINSR